MTVNGDPNEACVIRVYTNAPEILNMTSNEIKIPKGGSTRISLKFDPQNGNQINEFVLFLFKEKKPWQKILIRVQYG